MRYLPLLAVLLALPALAQQVVGPLDARNNLSEIAANGSGAQAAARANLGMSGVPVTVPTSPLLGGAPGAFVSVAPGTGLSLGANTLSILYGTGAGTALQGSLLGAAGGVAGLDSGAHVPLAQLPTIPASQLSGLAPSATTDATNAANITSGSLPAARLPTAAITGGTIGGISALGIAGTTELTNTGTSGQGDAQIAAAGGGSIPLQGQLQMASALSQYLAPDASEQFRVQTQYSATDSVGVMGGVNGAGPAVFAYSGTDSNADLNLSAFGGAGRVVLYGGAGYLATFSPPSGAIADYPAISSSVSGSPVIFGATGLDGVVNVWLGSGPTCGNAAIGPTDSVDQPVINPASCGATAIGRQTVVGGSDSFALGGFADADNNYAISIGQFSWNHGRTGGVCTASGSIIGQRGTEQTCLYTFRGTATGAATTQLLTTSGTINGYNSIKLATGSIFMSCTVAVLRTDSFAAASWAITNIGLEYNGTTLAFVGGVSPTVTAGPADAGVSGVSVAFALDTVNIAPKITVTTTTSGATYRFAATCSPMLEND